MLGYLIEENRQKKTSTKKMKNVKKRTSKQENHWQQKILLHPVGQDYTYSLLLETDH